MINCVPQTEIFKIIASLKIIAPPPQPISPVDLKYSLIQQNWSVTIYALTPRILTLKINQGTKFGTLKKPIFSLFDMIIFWFNGMIKQNINFRAQLPVTNIWNNCLPWIIAFPRIIAPLMSEKNINHFQLLFEEIWFILKINSSLKRSQTFLVL